MFTSSDSRVDYFLHRPSGFYSVVDRLNACAQSFCPLSNRESITAILKEHTCAGVVHVLFMCNPTAIIRRIWTIIVASINFMVVARWMAHIGKKVRQTIFPPVAHNNSPASISRIVAGGFPVASSLHS